MLNDAGQTHRTDPTPLVLDTDIGTDVDDLLALAVVLGSPELQATAVTTVYGDVDLRARIVAKVYQTSGRPMPDIAPGLGDTRSGREVWWPGHEGSTMDDLDEQLFAEHLSAVDILAAAELVVPIGPLTNIAAALERPASRIRRIVMMGGSFDDRTEHNIRSDIDAAEATFDSGAEALAVGTDITERVRFTEADLADLPGDLGTLIDKEVRRFWSFSEQPWNNPHDPIAVLTMTSPDLFTFARGRIGVDRQRCVTRFDRDSHGPHRIVRDLDVHQVHHELMIRIRRACMPQDR